MCGGTSGATGEVPQERGLSPRVRGNRDDDVDGDADVGSIPACAGEPMSVAVVMAVLPVYPRVCGGTTKVEMALWLTKGLSPRVRGNPTARRSALATPRSIPACAGEPSPAPP